MMVEALSAAELLQVWEWGQGQAPVWRALGLLSKACPESSLPELARLSIGQRDALLLDLRRQTFGNQLTVTAGCPKCEEILELDLPVDRLQATGQTPDQQGKLIATAAGWRVAFRLPNSQDLLDVTAQTGDGSRALLLDCLLEVAEGQAERNPGDLPEAVIAAVLAAMAQADPLADIRLALTCPACGHSWKPAFDPLAFFWEEIQRWAVGILQEVHWLAAAYGWSEADILALSPWRRRAYLEMVLA